MELPGSTNSMVSLVCLMHAEEGQDRDNHDDQPNQINKTAHFEFSLRKARDAAGTTRRSEISSARPTPRASALPDCACHAQFAVSKNAFPHKGIVRESRFLTDKLPSSACLRSRLGIALRRRHGGGGNDSLGSYCAFMAWIVHITSKPFCDVIKRPKGYQRVDPECCDEKAADHIRRIVKAQVDS